MSGGLGSLFFFFKQKTAYEVRISDWSSDVCASDLGGLSRGQEAARADYLASAAAASGARIAVAAQTADTYIAIRGLQSRIAIATEQIGRASRRERVCQYGWISVGAGTLYKKQTTHTQYVNYRNSHCKNSIRE